MLVLVHRAAAARAAMRFSRILAYRFFLDRSPPVLLNHFNFAARARSTRSSFTTISTDSAAHSRPIVFSAESARSRVDSVWLYGCRFSFIFAGRYDVVALKYTPPVWKLLGILQFQVVGQSPQAHDAMIVFLVPT